MAYGLDDFSSPFQNFRRSNILSLRGAQPSPTPTYPRSSLSGLTTEQDQPQAQPSNPWSRYDDRIMELMKPSQELGAYKQYLTTMPKESDYEPNWGTRIAAGLSGLSAGFRDPAAGVKLAQDIRDEPYKSALEDYARRGAGLKEAADLAQGEREGQVKFLQQARQMGVDTDKLAFERQKAAEADARENQKIEIDRQRAIAYIKKQGEKNYDQTAMADGGILFTNKADPNDTVYMPASKIGATLGSYQAQTGRMGALASQASASAALSQAGTAAGRLRLGERTQDWMENRGTEPPKAPEMAAGYQLAMQRLYADPLYKPFLMPGKNGLEINPDMMKDPRYQIFLNTLDTAARGAVEGNLFDVNPAATPGFGGRLYPSHRPGGGY